MWITWYQQKIHVFQLIKSSFFLVIQNYALLLLSWTDFSEGEGPEFKDPLKDLSNSEM